MRGGRSGKTSWLGDDRLWITVTQPPPEGRGQGRGGGRHYCCGFCWGKGREVSKKNKNTKGREGWLAALVSFARPLTQPWWALVIRHWCWAAHWAGPRTVACIWRGDAGRTTVRAATRRHRMLQGGLCLFCAIRQPQSKSQAATKQKWMSELRVIQI